MARVTAPEPAKWSGTCREAHLGLVHAEVPDQEEASPTAGPPPPDALGRRLLTGARVDMGDVVLSVPGLEPSYAEGVKAVKAVLAVDVPEALGFDPFETLRGVAEELDDLVTEVDDWIRVGNHVRPTTLVRKIIHFEGLMRTDHGAHFDDVPEDWAKRATRVTADLRSHLDHLVYALVTRAAPGPLEEDVLERLAYPVDDPSRPQTVEKLRKRLPHLSDDSLLAILEDQPSRLPVEYQRSWLWMLNRLNNLGKHRALNVAGTGRITQRGPASTVFAEGEILIPATDMLGGPCLDECLLDATIMFGVRDATQFAHEDGTFEPIAPLCRFLREAFALVGGITLELLHTEGIWVPQWEDAYEAAGRSAN